MSRKRFCVSCDSPLPNTEEHYQKCGNYCPNCSSKPKHIRKLLTHLHLHPKPLTLKHAEIREEVYEKLYAQVYAEMHQGAVEKEQKRIQDRVILIQDEPQP